MAAKTFNCRVVTPARELLSGAVTYASIPAHDGLMGVLPQHAPIVTRLGIGELKLAFPDTEEARGGDRLYFVAEGFAKMAGDELIILAEEAVPAEQLSESEAQAELAEAEARQAPADTSDATAVAEQIRRDREAARVKLRLARSAKARGI